MRRTYYAHIAGAGWVKDLMPCVICTPYFDKAMPLLKGALTELPELVELQFRGYRLRIVRVELDVVTERGSEAEAPKPRRARS